VYNEDKKPIKGLRNTRNRKCPLKKLFGVAIFRGEPSKRVKKPDEEWEMKMED